MNRTITITLNNTAFDIEEVAYDKLKDYLYKVEKYFSKEEAKDEIIKDIENSFASKLEDKLLGRKQKIVLEKDIDDLIKIIGRVEDFEKENEDEKNDNQTYRHYSCKKLYRNPDDVVLAGVCSGLASYLSVEASLIRVMFTLVTIFTGFFPGFVIYIVLWFILPIAETGSQKLEMEGEKITLEKIKDKVVKMKDDVKNATMNENNRSYIKQKVNNIKDKCKKTFNDNEDFDLEDDAKVEYKNNKRGTNRRNVLSIIVKIIFIIIGISLIAPAIFGLIGLAIAIPFIIFSPSMISHFVNIGNISSNYVQIISILGILIALIPTIFILVAGVSFLRGKNIFKIGSSIFLLIIWIFAISSLVFFSTRMFEHNNTVSFFEHNISYNTEEKIYDLEKFDSINIQGPYVINIKKNDNFLVKATSEDNNFDELNVEVKDGVLNIKQNNILNSISNNTTFDIDLPSIKELNIKGMTKVNLNGFDSNENIKLSLDGASNLDTDIFSNNFDIGVYGFSELKINNTNDKTGSKVLAKLNGASRLYIDSIKTNNINLDLDGASYTYISGVSNNVKIKETGASNIDLLKLESNTSNINLSGASSCKINSKNNITANLSGASSLGYYGDPVISKILKDLSTIDKIQNIEDSKNISNNEDVENF